MLFDLIFNITKLIDVSSNETVFDRWRKNEPNSDNTAPFISSYMGGGSDFAGFPSLPFIINRKILKIKSQWLGFSQRIGIPCLEQNFIRNKKDPLFKNTEIGTYPLYHTSYDNFRLVNDILDKNFTSIRLMALIISEMVRQLSDSLILPFNCIRYAKQLEIELGLLKYQFKKEIDNNVFSFTKLDYAISNFTRAAKHFHQLVRTLDKNE